jgi:hypothetical protein
MPTQIPVEDNDKSEKIDVKRDDYPKLPGIVRIKSDGPMAHRVSITIDGREIRATHATLDITPGNYLKLTVETIAELVDVEALQKNTELVIRDIRAEHMEAQRDHWPEMKQ